MKVFLLSSVFFCGGVFIMNIPSLIPVGAAYQPEAWKVFAALFFAVVSAIAVLEKE